MPMRNLTGYKLIQMFYRESDAWNKKEELESQGKEVLLFGMNEKHYVYVRSEAKIQERAMSRERLSR